MPFTPFHFGPGAALKAAAPAHFSFTIFCYSQVITDLETGFHILRGDYPLHTFFHTYLGATAVGLACAITGRPVCQLALRAWWARFPARLTALFGRPATIQWKVAFLTALIGTYSHVFLDSIMHPDVKPFSPWSASNPMLDLVSIPLLHLLCVGLGVVGILVLPFRTVGR